MFAANTPNILMFTTQNKIHHHIMPLFLGAARRQPTKLIILSFANFRFWQYHCGIHCGLIIYWCCCYVTYSTLAWLALIVDVTVSLMIEGQYFCDWFVGAVLRLFLRAFGASATENVADDEAARQVSGRRARR